MGDGLVERMNRSLLNLLRALVQTESDWEEHVQLLLFVYRTTKHSTTKLSPEVDELSDPQTIMDTNTVVCTCIHY